MSEQSRASHAFWNGLRWQWAEFDALFTYFAPILFTNMNEDLNLRRNNIELLAAFFTNQCELATTVADFLCFRQIMFDAKAWQLCWKGFSAKFFSQALCSD